ncbi:cyclophilin-like fold protein [Rhodovibrio salinarum]|uniref:MFS transporter n=1 Tax=Rhodovibrio salinarum TaxID=1087 RepID=A0A934QHP6_9PROT|nr:cyclophilin-like fold protein [Rhodovibrio salinarum]MBK1697223.1 MFS transporter [Rhodovibrio salinarum]
MKTTDRLSLSRRSFLAGAATTILLPTAGRSQNDTRRIRCSFAEQVAIYRLQDNATVRDLISMLPLDLTIEDFSTNEKIAHLPRRLDEEGFAPFHDETPGDLCYFLGWGNLAFFYDDYTFRDDLIRLGHIEGGLAPLRHKGKYPLRIELLS